MFTNFTKYVSAATSQTVSLAAAGNNRIVLVVATQINAGPLHSEIRMNGVAAANVVAANVQQGQQSSTIAYFLDADLPAGAGDAVFNTDWDTNTQVCAYYAENAVQQAPSLISSLSEPSTQNYQFTGGADADDFAAGCYYGNPPTLAGNTVQDANRGGYYTLSVTGAEPIAWSTNYYESGSDRAALISSISAASNSAPVVNDQTFSVADSASNGTVIGTLVATDSDGTVDSYAISGTTLAINSTTGQITLADNAGIVAGTPITATATVTDNGGGTDTATVTVNVTNSGLSFSCYDADSSNAAITSETLSHVRVLDPADLSEVATATSIATSSTGSAEIDTDSVTIGTDYLVIARRSNGDVCEPFSVTASDLAAS